MSNKILIMTKLTEVTYYLQMLSNFGSIGPFTQWFLALWCHGSEASVAEDTVAEGRTCTCWALLQLYT